MNVVTRSLRPRSLLHTSNQPSLYKFITSKTLFSTSSPFLKNDANEADIACNDKELEVGTGPLFVNHNNNYKSSYQTGMYGSTEVLNKDLVSDELPTVDLAYEAVLYNNKANTEDPPMIVLHGLFGSRTSNRSMVKYLSESLKRDIYLLDLRNHGASQHISRHDYCSMAADVERWVKKMNFETRKPIIVGHSMGAKVAMASVLRKPSLYSLLCSIDNVPVATFPLASFPKYATYLLKIVNDPNINTQKQCLEVLKPIEKRHAVQQFLLTTLAKYKDPETGKYRYKSKIPLGILRDSLIKGNISNWEYNSWVSKANIPSLFIKGSTSDYMSDEYCSEIGKFFPNFELHTVEGTHWVNSENPKGCADVITEYIERKEDK